MNLLDQIKADREAGTPGPWCTDTGGEVHASGRTIYGWPMWADQSAPERIHADMSRGARVPDMEAALLAAGELAEHHTQAGLWSEWDHTGGEARVSVPAGYWEEMTKALVTFLSAIEQNEAGT